jgi:hypothetical protein
MASAPRDLILPWQARHESRRSKAHAPKLNGVTADKARLLIYLPEGWFERGCGSSSDMIAVHDGVIRVPPGSRDESSRS